MKDTFKSNRTRIYHSQCEILLCVAVLFTFVQNLYSQLPDGTIASNAFIDTIKSNLNRESQERFNSLSNEITHTLTIDVYIINNDLGHPVVQPSQIAGSIDLLNSEFTKIGLQFKAGQIKYISEYVYGKYTTEDQINEITVKYGAPDKINLYMVDTIFRNERFYYGFTSFPDDINRNYIFLRKDYINGNYIITLMGHFFGLLSTHETLGGVERVNETNCRQAGDFICDTYADPGLFGEITDSCTYETPKMDPVGDYYLPTVANYMSESLGKCKCRFTPDQFRRMSFYLKNYRVYLK